MQNACDFFHDTLWTAQMTPSLVGGTFQGVLKEFSWHVNACLFVPALLE